MGSAVAESKCFLDGHTVESIKVGESIDPATKLAVSQFRVLCTCCGLTDKQLQDYKPLPKDGPMFRVAAELRAWRMKKTDGNPNQQQDRTQP